MTYTYCCVYSARLLVMDRDNCQKYEEPHSKNKFEKLVLLVGFIIGLYHDARSSECQNVKYVSEDFMSVFHSSFCRYASLAFKRPYMYIC